MTIHKEPRHMGFTIKDRGRATLIYIHAVRLCLAVPIKVPPLTLCSCVKNEAVRQEDFKDILSKENARCRREIRLWLHTCVYLLIFA